MAQEVAAELRAMDVRVYFRACDVRQPEDVRPSSGKRWRSWEGFISW